jgi:hypothetical protein
MRSIITTWSAIILLAGGILGVAAVFSANWPRDCSDMQDCHQQCECNRSHCKDECNRGPAWTDATSRRTIAMNAAINRSTAIWRLANPRL